MRQAQWPWLIAASLVVVGLGAFWIFDPVTREMRRAPRAETDVPAAAPPSSPAATPEHASPPAPPEPASPRAAPDPASPPAAPEEPARSTIERVPLQLDGVSGLSGLAVDPSGALWAVPERSRVLVRIDGASTTTIPLEGVPDGTDTESLDFIDGTHVAFGTETQVAGRAEDLVLIAELADGRGRVVESIPLPYSLLGIPAETNHGIEGLCVAGGTIVVAFETVDESEGLRRAVVATRPVAGGAWTVARVRLTSPTGKPSALACRMRGAQLDVLAVERHWEVMRLIAFTIDTTNAAAETTATLVEDLAGRLERTNLEGVAPRANGVDLVVDNDSGGPRGPNEVIHLARDPFPPR